MTLVGIGRWRRGALLVAACVAGGGAAAAIAAVPGSDGVIHACVNMTTANGQTVPNTANPNVVIIDPSAGQHCIPPDNPAPNQSSISFNVTGPQGPGGPGGPAGPAGAPGAGGGSGPAGPATTIAAGRTLTLAGGQVITVGGGPTLTVLTPPVRPNSRPVATLTIGTGPGALTSEVLSTSTSTGGASAGSTGATSRKVAIRDITITKKIDKSSPNLFLACATGKHFPTATLVFRKAGKIYLRFTFKLVIVKAISVTPSGATVPDESVTLNFDSQQIASS